MENVGNDNKRLFIIIVVIVTVLLSSTYAFLSLEDSTNSATGEGGCIDVNYEATVIDASNLISTDTEPTEAFSTITLSNKDNCEVYTEFVIKVNTSADETTANIGNDALKYNVSCSVAGGVTSNVFTSSGSINVTGDLEIATFNFDEPTVDVATCDVYIWVDSSISKGSYNGETYSGYIYAESRQSSTVKE